ncbi:MAG: NAD(P)/FAD-dependent oxidoreductase [Candidatus Micrarchaeota archaeon]|nr:NAD(P)/FAD-dependent oxidoreductase [Candidatus Micrarchaeota archaeon]
MVDVHIVGGGPAGCFAGISACLEGKSVLLSEEHKSIGEPEACSGLISKSGLDSLLPYINYKEVVLNTILSAKITCEGEEFIITPKEEIALLISRCGLDSLAAERFVQEGGKIELGKRVTRKFASKNIIGADGPASAVADYFGFPRIKSYVACMQGNFKYSCQDPHQTEVFLSSKDFPGFFGWVIPINEDEAKIGLGVALPSHPIFYYRRFLSKLGVKQKALHEFSAVIPLSVRSKTAMRAGGYNVLLAGDSAGQVKATTGGGVFFGAQCGLLAGKYHSSPESYEKSWRASFGLDLALHHSFRSFLNLWDGAPPPFLVSAAKGLLFEDLLSENGKMDRWSAMLSPSLPLAYASIAARRFMGSGT